jgi:hypothetical protein
LTVAFHDAAYGTGWILALVVDERRFEISIRRQSAAG